MATSVSAHALGQLIKQLRVQNGLTQQDLAGEDYTKSHISAIEHGKARPSLQALQKIAVRLNVPAGDFFELVAEVVEPAGPELPAPQAPKSRGTRPETKDVPTKPSSRAKVAPLDIRLAQAERHLHRGQHDKALEILRPLISSDATPKRGRHPIPSNIKLKALYLAAKTVIGSGCVDEAFHCLNEGMRLAASTADQAMLVTMRNLLGTAYFQSGDFTSALEQHRRCVEAVDSGVMPDPNFKLLLYNNLGGDYRALCEYDKALTAYQVAIEVAATLGSLEQQANISRALCPGNGDAEYFGYAASSSPYASSEANLRACHRAIGILEALDNLRRITIVEGGYGGLMLDMGNLSEAEAYLRQRTQVVNSLNDDPELVVILTNLALLDMQQGNIEEARGWINRAIEVCYKTLDYRGATTNCEEESSANYNATMAATLNCRTRSMMGKLVRALAIAGEIEQRSGEDGSADELFWKAIAIGEAAGLREENIGVYQRYARALVSRGRHEQATNYFERAYQLQGKGR